MSISGADIDDAGGGASDARSSACDVVDLTAGDPVVAEAVPSVFLSDVHMHASVVTWLHVPRLRSCVDDTQCVPQICWRLQPRCDRDPVWHCLDMLGIQLNRFRRFKIGHTHVPHRRWLRFVRDNQRSALLMFVFISEDNVVSGSLEIDLIRKFKGDYRCMNLRPGGELTDIGVPPFFIYLAFHERFRRIS